MTAEEDLARIDSVIDNTHSRAADSLTVGRRTVKSLVADSRALRELVEALPKCDGHVDSSPCAAATFIWADGRQGGRHGYWCDEHSRGGKGVAELPTAAITRRLGL